MLGRGGRRGAEIVLDGLSDRDKLAFAFDELDRRGVRASIEVSEACCYLAALQLIEPSLAGYAGFAFWTKPRDDVAFGLVPVILSCEHAGIVGSDDRPKSGSMLRRSLSLYWHGPVDLMVSVLRSWGLFAVAPNGPSSSIEVLSLAEAKSLVDLLPLQQALIGSERLS